MEKMSFGSFTWSQNPQKLCLTRTREAQYTKNEEGETKYSGIGEGNCVVTGSGCFSGNGAYDSCRALAELFESGVEATLFCPGFGSMQAHFTSFETQLANRQNQITYTFRFHCLNSSGEIPK